MSTTHELSFYDIVMGRLRPLRGTELAAIEAEANATAALEVALNALARGECTSTTVVALWRAVETARMEVTP